MLGVKFLSPEEALQPLGENEGIRIIITASGKRALKQGLLISAVVNTGLFFGVRKFVNHAEAQRKAAETAIKVADVVDETSS